MYSIWQLRTGKLEQTFGWFCGITRCLKYTTLSTCVYIYVCVCARVYKIPICFPIQIMACVYLHFGQFPGVVLQFITHSVTKICISKCFFKHAWSKEIEQKQVDVTLTARQTKLRASLWLIFILRLRAPAFLGTAALYEAPAMKISACRSRPCTAGLWNAIKYFQHLLLQQEHYSFWGRLRSCQRFLLTGRGPDVWCRTLWICCSWMTLLNIHSK